MQWKLVGAAALLGLFMGTCSVNGYTKKIELFLWIFLALALALVVGKAAAETPFRNGLASAFVTGLCSTILQVCFFSYYIANNPEAAAFADKVPGGLALRTFYSISGPIIAGVYGLCVSLLSMLFAKLLTYA